MVRLILFLGFCFLISCNEIIEETNEKNLQKVKVGANYKEVLKIMGKPVRYNLYPLEDDMFFVEYKAPFASSGNYQIYISSKDSTVLSIYHGD